MRRPAEKVERLLRAVHAVFAFAEFNAGLLMKQLSGPRLKQAANAELHGALVALTGGGRMTRQRVGQMLNRDFEGARSDEANLKLVSRYDAKRKLWLYQLAEIQTQAESDAMLKEIQDDMLARQLAFQAKYGTGRNIGQIERAFNAVNRAERKMEREEERNAAQLERWEVATANRAHDKLLREVDRAKAEYERVGGKIDLYATRNSWRQRSGAELEQQIAEYKAETKRLQATSDYARVVAEIAKTRHTVTPELVRQILEIEALRRSHWLAGMSINPDDYKDYSSGRFAPRSDTSTLRDSIQLRGNWSPFKF